MRIEGSNGFIKNALGNESQIYLFARKSEHEFKTVFLRKECENCEDFIPRNESIELTVWINTNRRFSVYFPEDNPKYEGICLWNYPRILVTRERGSLKCLLRADHRRRRGSDRKIFERKNSN